MALYLASEEAAGITGQAYTISAARYRFEGGGRSKAYVSMRLHSGSENQDWIRMIAAVNAKDHIRLFQTGTAQSAKGWSGSWQDSEWRANRM